MDLKLKLTEGKGLSAIHVRFKDGCEGLEFPALDVDLEDVDVRVAIHLHETRESVHGRLGRVIMVVCAGESIGLKVSTGKESGIVLDFRAEAVD